MAAHPESWSSTGSRTKIRRRPKETVAAGAQKNSRIGACVSCLFATNSRGTRERPEPPLGILRGVGIGPCARLERYYVCLCAACHPPLTLITHRMPRPFLQTNAWLRPSLLQPISLPSRAGQAATTRHGRVAAPWVYIEGVGGWRSVDAQWAHV